MISNSVLTDICDERDRYLRRVRQISETRVTIFDGSFKYLKRPIYLASNCKRKVIIAYYSIPYIGSL